MLYSIQLFTEQRSARKCPFSAERVHVATVKCSELRANGNPVAYALRQNARFSSKITLVKVFALENNGKSTRWRQIEARML